MAKQEKKAETVKSSVKTKEFTLKEPLNGKKPGDKVSLGPDGERFYKRKNVI